MQHKQTHMVPLEITTHRLFKGINSSGHFDETFGAILNKLKNL